MHKRRYFSTLTVLKLNNYDPLPVQEYSKIEYSNFSKGFQVEWETVRENNQRNTVRLKKKFILRYKPGSRNAARSVADSIESLSLFIPNPFIDSIVKFTNNRC